MPKQSITSVKIKDNTTIAIITPSKTKLSSPQTLLQQKKQLLDIKSKTTKKRSSSIKKPKLYAKPPVYAKYIKKVLKQQHPQLSISGKSILVVDNFIKDMFTQIVTEASQLVKFSKRKTLTHRDINTACKLILTGQLQDLATNEAAKAMIRFSNSFNNKKPIRTNDSETF